MRIFAISDIHIDFEDNRRWFENLSRYDYQEDLLILAGDVTDIIPMFEKVFRDLKDRFSEVLYIPGNHDLWVYRQPKMDSLEKLDVIKKIAASYGVRMNRFIRGRYQSFLCLAGTIIPLGRLRVTSGKLGWIISLANGRKVRTK